MNVFVRLQSTQKPASQPTPPPPVPNPAPIPVSNPSPVDWRYCLAHQPWQDSCRALRVVQTAPFFCPLWAVEAL